MLLLHKLESYKVLLGSQSPRRKMLLEGAGFKFTVLPPIHHSEEYPVHLTDKEIAIFLAQQKALAYTNFISDSKTILITADTIVSLQNKILEKPKDRADAIQMLQQLSGNTHSVFTGVCIKTLFKNISFVAETEVFFRTLTNEEIEYYVDFYKPYDKAGSYGAQEWIGYVGIQHINGSYFNVMGLPIQKLYVELENLLK